MASQRSDARCHVMRPRCVNQAENDLFHNSPPFSNYRWIITPNRCTDCESYKEREGQYGDEEPWNGGFAGMPEHRWIYETWKNGETCQDCEKLAKRRKRKREWMRKRNADPMKKPDLTARAERDNAARHAKSTAAAQAATEGRQLQGGNQVGTDQKDWREIRSASALLAHRGLEERKNKKEKQSSSSLGKKQHDEQVKVQREGDKKRVEEGAAKVKAEKTPLIAEKKAREDEKRRLKAIEDGKKKG